MITIKTIVIFTTHAFSLINFRRKLIEELVIRSHKVHTIAPDFDAKTRAVLTELGVTTHDCYFDRNGTKIFADLKASFHLYRLLKSLKADCILSYFIKPVIYGTICGFFAGIHHRVAMIEGLGSVFSSSQKRLDVRKRVRLGLVAKMYKLALIFAARVIFLNQDDINEFSSRGILKSKNASLLGGIGVDLAEWVNTNPIQNPVTFILSARLLREKGVVDFVDAAKKIKSMYPETRFILLGGLDSNLSSLCQDEVAGWARSGVIEWPGHVEVKPWLAQASVFVLPSYYREGVPRSSQEALAMSLPIITTDSVGCKETVVNGLNGYLVPVKNVEAIVEKMTLFLKNPDLIVEMGKQSRIIAEQKFSEKDKIIAQLEFLKC
ncbi:glycosyltransferase family 4 protein [Amylibacter sp.]|nr:glycosyltransferase family 4 protein [Amylibacter sp.]